MLEFVAGAIVGLVFGWVLRDDTNDVDDDDDEDWNYR